MPIPSSGSLSDDWHDHPLCHLLSVPEIKQVEVIGCKTAPACCSSIDNHLEGVDCARSMSSSRRWSNSCSIKLLPLEVHEIESVCISSYDVLACVSSGSTKQNDFAFADLSDGMAESCERDLSKSVYLFKLLVIAHF